jgi:hypothetical protein
LIVVRAAEDSNLGPEGPAVSKKLGGFFLSAWSRDGE